MFRAALLVELSLLLGRIGRAFIGMSKRVECAAINAWNTYQADAHSAREAEPHTSGHLQ